MVLPSAGKFGEVEFGTELVATVLMEHAGRNFCEWE